MNINWKYAGVGKSNFEEIIGVFKDSEFKSYKRSTVPFLDYWRETELRISELINYLHLSIPDSLDLDIEHQVPVKKGKGKASCSDMKIISSDFSITIEAKFTEKRYDTCEKWLRLGKNRTNRELVLTGWLELLNEWNSCRLQIKDVLYIPYQMIHRAASACAGNSKKRILIYQVFRADETKSKMYIGDLTSLKVCLGDSRKLQLYYLNSNFKGQNTYEKLESRWKNGERDLSRKVIEGLLNKTLIDQIGNSFEQI